MLLSTAFVAPEEVRAELAELTDLVGYVVPRLGRLPRPDGRLPITGFGNMSVEQSRRLVGLLEELVVGWGPLPRVRFARPDVTLRGDVVLGLTGEVEGLVSMARSVPVEARKLGMYVDRRMFWPGLSLGEVPGDVPLTGVGERLRELAGWEGREWSVPGIALLRGVIRPEGASLEQFALVPA